MGKFKVGDKVRVKDIKIDTVSHGYNFVYGMTKYIGKIFTIGVGCDDSCYMLKEAMYCWAEAMYCWAKDWLEPIKIRNKENIMRKFKLGDKVRVRNIKVDTLSHGLRFAPEMSKYIGKEFTITGSFRHGVYMLDGMPFGWAEDWLEPVKPETIVIYRNDDKTIAFDKTTGKKAEAKCSKDDTYDFYTGARIAFERLIGEDKAKEEPKPKLYNGKVVCVKSKSAYITEGRIYEFKDGYSKYDDGSRMLTFGDGFDSFEDLKNRMVSEFVELVED